MERSDATVMVRRCATCQKLRRKCKRLKGRNVVWNHRIWMDDALICGAWRRRRTWWRYNSVRSHRVVGWRNSFTSSSSPVVDCWCCACSSVAFGRGEWTAAVILMEWNHWTIFQASGQRRQLRPTLYRDRVHVNLIAWHLRHRAPSSRFIC